MSFTAVERVEAAGETDDEAAPGLSKVVLATGLRTLFAAISGLTLTCGLGLLLWAITPASGSGPVPLVRAGVTAFAAANGMTVVIGRSALNLPPLMITIIAVALLTGVSGRGRVVVRGRTQELVSTVVAATVYAAAVVGAGVGLGSPGAVTPSWWWCPAALALVVVGVTTLARGDGWRPYLVGRLPDWAPVAVRLGASATAVVIGGGAVTLLIGLVRSFGDATSIQTLAAPGAAGGFGMALLGIAYLPNAVIAGAGYATGVGFTIGGGVYSPFGSTPVELPAIPLLAAAPDGHVVSRPTLVLLLFPVLAGVLVGRGAVRRLSRRADRLLAAAAAAVLAGAALALLAAVAAGGVAGGSWASSGVPPALFGAVVAAGLGVVGAAVSGVARVPRVARVPSAGAATPEKDAAVEESAGEETADAVTSEDETPEQQAAGEATAEDQTPEQEAAEGAAPEDETAEQDAAEGRPAEVVPDFEPDTAVVPGAGPTVDDGHGREEDLLAETDQETERALIAGLARPSAPRRTG